MKKIIFITALFFTFCMNPVYCQTKNVNYPSFYKILTVYLQSNAPDDLSRLNFKKDKDGWSTYNLTYNYDEKKWISDESQLIWDSKTRAFTELVANKRQSSKSEIQKDITAYATGHRNEWYNFDRMPYFGGDGWAQEVIALLENQQNLSDTALEALARAYDAYASVFLWDQYGYGTPADEANPLRKKLPGLQLPSASRINEFIKYQDKTIACYKKLLERNPDYNTFVGSIALRLFDQQFYTYLMLSLCNEYTRAQQYLDQCNPPSYLVIAYKNIFTELPQNSLLLLTGDIDTYTLLYLQDKLNVRKDVAVVNGNLIGTIPYVHNNVAKRLNVTTPATAYGNDKFSYCPVPETRENSMNVADVLRHYPEIFATEGAPFVCKYAVLKDGANEIPVRFDGYIDREHLMILDVVASNMQTHPVFSFSSFPEYMLSIEDDAQRTHGLLYKLGKSTVTKDSAAKRQFDLLSSMTLEAAPGVRYLDAEDVYSGIIFGCKALYDYYNNIGKRVAAQKVCRLLKDKTAAHIKDENITSLLASYLLIANIKDESLCKTLEQRILREIEQGFFRPNGVTFFDADQAIHYLEIDKTVSVFLKRSTVEIDKMIARIKAY